MAFAVLAAGALALALGWHWAGVAAILCGLAIAAFFRDPERSPANSPPSAWCSRAPTAP